MRITRLQSDGSCFSSLVVTWSKATAIRRGNRDYSQTSGLLLGTPMSADILG
jgi:hypothetical protein